MSENLQRHLICIIATLSFAVVYWAAYSSGAHGWWWTFIGVLFIYMLVYKLTGGGGGHH